MSAPMTPRTVVEALVPHTGMVALGEVYAVANLAGIADQPLRLAIRRMIEAGDVVQEGRGRAGTLALTIAGSQRLQRDRQSLALAFAQDAGQAPWDGLWRLVAVTVPERERAIRDAWRRELTELGAVAISTSLYVSPHTILGALEQEGRHYLSTATTADLAVRGTTNPHKIAEMLWPQEPIISAYATLAQALHADASDLSAPPVLRQLRLADALENAMRDDPLLPLELRAGPWKPSEIRTAWSARWSDLQAADGGAIFRGW